MTQGRGLTTGARARDLKEEAGSGRGRFAKLLAVVMVTAMFVGGLLLIQAPTTVTAQGDERLTTDAEADIQPDWSPDAATILFDKRPDTGCCTGRLWLMDSAGSNPRQLSSSDVEESGSFSPDGTEIAFAKWPSSRGDYSDILVMNAVGTGVVERSPGGTLTYNAPRWSHDGTRIVGHAIDGTTGNSHVGTHRLWIMNADGSGFRVILDRGSYPVFLPGDAEILFVDFDLEESNFHLALLSLGSGNVTQLTVGPADVDPDVSRDGKILFTRCDTYPAPTACDLYTTDQNGATFERLTFDGAGNTMGRFSPDGRAIAYVSDRSGNRDIWVHRFPVPAPANFGVTVSPASRTVVAGENTDYFILLTEEGDFTGRVTLTVSGAPTSLNVSFAGNLLTPVASTTMTVAVDTRAAPGTYTLTVRGNGGGEEQSASAQLIILSPQAATSTPATDLRWAIAALAVLPFLLVILFLARRSRRKDRDEPTLPQPVAPKLEAPPLRGLSARERLTLLEERLARGEVSEPLYRELRQKYESDEKGVG